MQFKFYKFKCHKRIKLEDAVKVAAQAKKCNPLKMDIHDFRERHDQRDKMWHYKIEWLD